MVLVTLGSLHTFSSAVGSSATCQHASEIIGECSSHGAEISNDGVELGGSIRLPGEAGDAGGSEQSAPDTQPAPGAPPAESVGWQPGPVLVEGSSPVAPFEHPELLIEDPRHCAGDRICYEDLFSSLSADEDDEPSDPDEGGTPGTPAITITDVARFAPDSVAAVPEPGAWTVVGLDTNFVVNADQHTVAGELLGAPATVRFTPVLYDWDYGDGATARLTEPGSSWSELGVREFDPTPTSHRYTASGTFTVTVEIGYLAEYSIGGEPFVPVRGALVIPLDPIEITANTVTTVLVHDDCRATPRGPGC